MTLAQHPTFPGKFIPSDEVSPKPGQLQSGDLDELRYLPKPKGMHWRTFYRLREAAQEASDRSWREMAVQLLKYVPEDRVPEDRLGQLLEVR